MPISRTALLACFVLAGFVMTTADAEPPARPLPVFPAHARVLFQGDSITDGNRGRSEDPNHILGHGYVFLVAAECGARQPERANDFVNRGVSGNTVADLAKRWQADTLDLKPAVLSVLVGVNDLNAGVPVDVFREQYAALLERTTKALPGVRLVLCEPFGLPTGAKKDGWAAYHAELAKRQAVVVELGKRFDAPVVHFQAVLDDAVRRAPAEYWVWDGIHPTYRGHQLLADEWLRMTAGMTFERP